MGSADERKKVKAVDTRYNPTKEEMEEDVSIDATPEEVARALFAGDPPVVKSGKGKGSKRSWKRWILGR